MDSIIISNVSKSFKKIRALNNVSLSIKKGELFGLLGPNGAGKTTLLSILTGLTTADSGKAEILGMDVEKDLYKILQEINMVRGFSGVPDKMTARELLSYYAMLYELKNRRKKVEETMKLAGIKERKDGIVANFSSGFRQRFFIAKAMLNDPEVLLLDEPTVGLDVRMAMDVRELIKKLNKKGVTIILTTHYMKEAEELCGRIAVIHKGRIITIATPKELMEKTKLKTLEEVFLQLTRDEDVG